MKTFQIFDTENKLLTGKLYRIKDIEAINASKHCTLEPVKDAKNKITGYKITAGALSFPIVKDDGSLSDSTVELIEAVEKDSGFEPYFSEDKFIGFKIVPEESSPSEKPGKDAETKKEKPGKSKKFLHTFKFSFQQFISVMTNSTDKEAAFAEAVKKLVENKIEAARHSRYDGCKEVD